MVPQSQNTSSPPSPQLVPVRATSTDRFARVGGCFLAGGGRFGRLGLFKSSVAGPLPSVTVDPPGCRGRAGGRVDRPVAEGQEVTEELVNLACTRVARTVGRAGGVGGPAYLLHEGSRDQPE